MISELAEEFPTTTGHILRTSLLIVAILQCLLTADGLPFSTSLVQLLAYGSYYFTLRNFPFIDLFSIPAITSVVLFLITNLLWLRHFLPGRYDTLPILGKLTLIKAVQSQALRLYCVS